MKAILLRARGGPESLAYGDLPRPRPRKGEVLVRVHATAVTPTEFAWVPTWRTPTGEARPFPIILGHEFSGVVADLGPGVTALSEDSPVYGFTDWFSNGTDAEYCVSRVTELAPKPRSIDHVHAAVVPISAVTAWQGLFDRGGLRAGQRALIHGAAGGVGSFAVQLARWRGGHVIGTASGGNLDFVHELGADEVVDYKTTRFEEIVHDVDVVFDTVGGDTLERSRRVLKPSGKMVTIATQSAGSTDEAVRNAFFVVEAKGEQLAEIARLIDAGHLRPVVDIVFALAQARQAYEYKPRRGKVVLRVLE